MLDLRRLVQMVLRVEECGAWIAASVRKLQEAGAMVAVDRSDGVQAVAPNGRVGESERLLTGWFKIVIRFLLTGGRVKPHSA